MIFASTVLVGDNMPDIELPTFYLIAVSFSVLTMSVLLLTAKVAKLLRVTAELKNNLRDVATTDSINQANKKLDTDLVNTIFLLENNMTQRCEEILAEVIELRTNIAKYQARQPKLPAYGTKEFDKKLEDAIVFAREGVSSQEISARLNLKHEFVQDIIQFNKKN